MRKKGWLVFGLGGLMLILGLRWASSSQTRGAGAQITLENARDKLVKELYKGQLERRALFAAPQIRTKGSRIADWRNPAKLSVDDDSWFFFVDEHPGANWEHPAKYVLVNKISGAVRSAAAKTPPLEMLEMKGMNPEAVSQLGIMKKNFEMAAKVTTLKRVPLARKQKAYAVLVSGGWNASSNYGRYWKDLSFIYKTLKDKFGYTDSEIIVLYASGSHSPSGDLDGDGAADIDDSATKANLTTAMNFVKDNIPADGKFFFYSTNHGGQEVENTQDAVLYLWGEWIADQEFAALTKNIRCSEAIYVMEQCFSGGMMDDILGAQTYPCSNPKVCIMTAANFNEPSWGCDTEGEYDEYVYHWVSAVNGKTPAGAAVNADSNGDGKVSMKEAHEYAKNNDSRNEHPTSGSCIGPACDSVLNRPLLIKR